MLMGLVLWIVVTLASSFVPPELFRVFLFTRCLVGIGEASYSTIAPTIISDLFVGSARTKALGFFYFAVPVGSGFGYVVGSAMARMSGEWQWALRVTPLLGIVCVLLLVYLHQDPPRGLAEGAPPMSTTAWWVDLKYLVCNSAFVLVSGGFTCVCFILGALTWFGVHLIEMGIDAAHDDPMAWRMYDVPLIFGISLCFAGIIGVLLGSYLGRRLSLIQPNADALVCAGSQFICAPVLFFTLLSPSVSFFLCVSVVVPTRRSTASAVQMIMTHALGDCISPAIVGAISDGISDIASLETQYLSLQRALFLTPFVCVLGALLFSLLSLCVVEGRLAVLRFIEESKLFQNSTESTCGASSPAYVTDVSRS
ncbi:hypothetical protein T265_00134 [Opisthorchis viverrini]|uniref:Major facilitator superfamily (MFS) profile domain-containing protein n=1 Tax=Opisthorchis viverrini TaxID=6198 RepID=A0A075A7E0_OPIVI|nr:hypothetical protein T265_00134 [Opisthorchis viverrini]KER34287.1 hypothetical protein T265_00134 [Opisthorchis viverrini]